MNVPQNLKYSNSHEWVDFGADGKAKIGLTDYAQNSLGELVFVNLPEVDDELTMEESFGDVESVKAVSDIISPLTATVARVNEALLDDPAAINTAPYDSWLVEVGDIGDQAELMDAAAYEEFCKQEG